MAGFGAERRPMVHLSSGSNHGRCLRSAEAGLCRQINGVVGRQSVLDLPGRGGQAALWVQLQEVPFSPVGDAESLRRGRLDEI
jgi:hypothetical protein